MLPAFRGLAAALALTGFALPTLAGPALARDVVPAEKRFWSYDGDLPSCDNAKVLSRLQDRFEQTESEYWNSKLQIVSVDQVRVNALRPWGLDHIPRNFCIGRALLNDNTYHEVSYDVAEDLGIIGMDFGVEFCVAGLDRELAYAPACKTAEP